MNTRWLVAVATLGAWLTGMTALQAADTWPVGKGALENGSLGDPAKGEPIERVVQFGTTTGAMMKIVITNDITWAIGRPS